MASNSVSNFEKALFQLDKWFQNNSRQLPWRDFPAPYRVWVSEIMLQQTQVITVVEYFNRFVYKFPTLKDLAQATESEVVALWSGLGYYSRARNLLKTAKLMDIKEGVPSTRLELEALPGIGPYTAGAILSIAFNQYEAILDGNLDRIFSRMLQIPRNSQYKNRLWMVSWLFIKKAEKLNLSPSVINQALMEVGALICKPKQPVCGECPLRLKCKSYYYKTIELYPQKAKRKSFIQLQDERLFFIDSYGRFLIVKDPNQRWRKGTWDLPLFEKENFPSKLYLHLLHQTKDKNNKVINYEWLKNNLEKKTYSVSLTVTHHKINRKIMFFSFLNFLKDKKYLQFKAENFSFTDAVKSFDQKNFFWKEGDLEFGLVFSIKNLPVGSPLIKSLKAVKMG